MTSIDVASFENLLCSFYFQLLNLPLNDICIDILIKRLDRDQNGEVDFGLVTHK